MKPYYEEGNIKIYHGDSRDVMPILEPVDLVLTDPPYGVGKQQRTCAKKSGITEAWDDEFPTWWLHEASRLAPVLGWMPGVGNLCRIPETVGRLTYRWTLAVHVLNGMTRSPIGYGNWIPCCVYVAEGASVYAQQGDIGRVAVSGTKPDHPSPKPIAAMRWLVNRLPGQAIIDPFMGSGSTLIAAKEAGRSAIGIEIDERYCEVAVKRLEGAS